MGAHFYINQFTFKSKLPEEELEQAWKKFTTKLDEDNQEYMDLYYGFTYRGCEGGKLHKYTLWMRDNETKYDDDVELLSRFVSTIIAPGTHTLIEVETGGNEKWGYLVIPGQAYELTYTMQISVNGTPLEAFLVALQKGKTHV